MPKTETNTLPVIAQRLREARLRVGISQKNLGIQAGIDEFSASARMNQYEKGKHVPDFQMLEKFASILNVPTEYFYARDDVMAEILLLFSDLSQEHKTSAIAYIKELRRAEGEEI